MAQVVIEKRKNPISEWFRQHKRTIIKSAIISAGLTTAFFGGKFIEDIRGSLGLEMARADGFLRLVNPETGETCDYKTWIKLISRHYDL